MSGMASEVVSVTDPLGNDIFLLEGVCIDEEKTKDEEI